MEIKEESNILDCADILIYDTKEVIQFYQSYIGTELVGKSKPLMLLPDPRSFPHSPTPEFDGRLKVIWWGVASKLHGLEVIFDAIKKSRNVAVDYTIIITDTHSATSKTLLEWKRELHNAPVTFISWEEIEEETMPSKKLNTIIQAHHVCLGIFNMNKHFDCVYSNKEIEAILLGRVLVTRKRREAIFPDGAVIFEASDSDDIVNCLKSISCSKKKYSSETDVGSITHRYANQLNSIFPNMDIKKG
jgi:hypothetical protein